MYPCDRVCLSGGDYGAVFQYPLRIVYPCDYQRISTPRVHAHTFQYPLRIVYPCDMRPCVLVASWTSLSVSPADRVPLRRHEQLAQLIRCHFPFSIPCGSCTPATRRNRPRTLGRVRLSVSPADRVPLRLREACSKALVTSTFSIPCGSCTPATKNVRVKTTIKMFFQYPLRIVYPCDTNSVEYSLSLIGLSVSPADRVPLRLGTRARRHCGGRRLSVSPADRVPLRLIASRL